MTANRWAAAGAGALLVLTTALAATAAPAATTSASAASAPVKKAFRSYGAGPVKLDGQDARVSFAGEKGDIVHLDAGAKLKGSTTKLKLGSRKIGARWDGFWKLPRSGDYTFSFTAPGGDPAGRELQLQKVRVASTVLDAKPVAGRKQPRGYLNAVSLSLRDGERALLSSKDWRHTVLTPDGLTERVVGLDLQLEVGRQIHSTIGSITTAELGAGTLLVLSQGNKVTRVTRSVVKPITTDGTVTEFTSDAQPREYVFTFDGAVGDVVIPDFHGTPTWKRVFQPPKRSQQAGAPLSGAYWFFDAGTARYSVITSGKAGKTTRLSLTKALKGPAVTSLDTPVTLANTKPGQYVAVTLPPYPSLPPAGLSASNVAFTSTDGATPRWSVYVEPAAPYYCLTQPNGPLGCGEYSPLTVNQGYLTASMGDWYGYTGDSLVLAVPPTVSGSVTITLQKPEPPA